MDAKSGRVAFRATTAAAVATAEAVTAEAVTSEAVTSEAVTTATATATVDSETQVDAWNLAHLIPKVDQEIQYKMVEVKCENGTESEI